MKVISRSYVLPSLMGEENAIEQQTEKFAILIETNFQYVLNCRAEDMKSSVGEAVYLVKL